MRKICQSHKSTRYETKMRKLLLRLSITFWECFGQNLLYMNFNIPFQEAHQNYQVSQLIPVGIMHPNYKSLWAIKMFCHGTHYSRCNWPSRMVIGVYLPSMDPNLSQNLPAQYCLDVSVTRIFSHSESSNESLMKNLYQVLYFSTDTEVSSTHGFIKTLTSHIVSYRKEN